jgi:hypothetical protein
MRQIGKKYLLRWGGRENLMRQAQLIPETCGGPFAAWSRRVHQVDEPPEAFDLGVANYIFVGECIDARLHEPGAQRRDH